MINEDSVEQEALKAFAYHKGDDDTITANQCAGAIIKNINGVIPLNTIIEKIKLINKASLSQDEFSTIFIDVQREALEIDASAHIHRLLLGMTEEKSNKILYHELFTKLMCMGDNMAPKIIDEFFKPYISPQGTIDIKMFESEEIQKYLK